MTWTNQLGTFEWIAIALFILLYLLYLRRMQLIGKVFTTYPNRITFKLILRSIALTLLMIALLGPSFGESTTREVKVVGKDIFILVDLSESMNAFDIQPSRLEKLTLELKNLVKNFTSDRMGLIIFSTEAFMQCPLTYDQGAINLFLETLNTDLVPGGGTDFGPPLEMAYEKFMKEQSHPDVKRKSSIMLLISDGEDFGENTMDIVDKINSEGIRLFTMGIGTSKGSKIPTRRGFKKDRQGQEVLTQLNPVSLKAVSSATGGEYFEISDVRNDLNRLIASIEAIEGETKESKEIKAEDNKYYYFLFIALGLFLLDFMLTLPVVRLAYQ